MSKRRLYVASIEKDTERNRAFRRVLATGTHMQLVVQSLERGEEVGEEVHSRTDQFVRVESGRALIRLNGKAHRLLAGEAALIPAGTRHNILNDGVARLQFYTLYAPPEHDDGEVRTEP